MSPGITIRKYLKIERYIGQVGYNRHAAYWKVHSNGYFRHILLAPYQNLPGRIEVPADGSRCQPIRRMYTAGPSSVPPVRLHPQKTVEFWYVRYNPRKPTLGATAC